MKFSIRQLAQRMTIATVGISLFASGAHAQGNAALELAQLVASSDALGDDWVLSSSGPDTSLSGFSPKPVAAYGARFSQAPMTADVVLDEYADRATALASPGLNDPSSFWGHGAGGLQQLSGYGDGESYRIYPIGKGATSALTFVDGNIVAFIRTDGFGTEDDADALADQLASVEDALLKSAGTATRSSSATTAPSTVAGPAKPSAGGNSPEAPGRLSVNTAQPAMSALAGVGGKLVYLSQSGDLAILDGATGSIRTLVSANGSTLGNPHWSPDGKFVAFSRHDPTNEYCGCAGLPAHLEIVPTDGSASPRRVTQKDTDAVNSLQWFADGKTLAYGYGGNGVYQSARVSVDGQANQVLFDVSHAPDQNPPTHFAPVVSPDSKHIAATVGSETGHPDIYISDADGTNARQLVHDANNGQETGFWGPFLTWMPDGSGVAYAATNAVMVAPLDGSPATQLIDAPGPVDSGTPPAISQDGSEVAFVYSTMSPPVYDVPWTLGIANTINGDVMSFNDILPGGRLSGRIEWVSAGAGVIYVSKSSYEDPGTLRLALLSDGTSRDVLSGVGDFDWHS
jgi:hypothetical protein